MNITSDQVQPASHGTKPLWAAIGALGVAVLAMGSALVYVQTRPVEPHASAVPAANVEVAAVSPEAPAPATSRNSVAKEKQASNAGKPAPGVVRPATSRVPSAADAAAGHQPVAHAGTPACANCGTVTTVTPVEREGTPSGAGVVAGGVLGALVGNQVGGGNGKAAATILGAIGGGWAGNTVEKKMKKETVYQVRVRMEDGSMRTFEQTTPASVGAKVTVEGRALRSADGSLSTPVPVPVKKPAAAPVSGGG